MRGPKWKIFVQDLENCQMIERKRVEREWIDKKKLYPGWESWIRCSWDFNLGGGGGWIFSGTTQSSAFTEFVYILLVMLMVLTGESNIRCNTDAKVFVIQMDVNARICWKSSPFGITGSSCSITYGIITYIILILSLLEVQLSWKLVPFFSMRMFENTPFWCHPVKSPQALLTFKRHLPVTKADILCLYRKKAGGKNCRGNLPGWRIDMCEDINFKGADRVGLLVDLYFVMSKMHKFLMQKSSAFCLLIFRDINC